MDPAIGIRAEMYRTLLGILPGSTMLPGLTYTHVAEAEAPNGVADVIDVTGPDNFRARLFVDQKKHRPLMVSFTTRQPRQRQFTPPPDSLKTQEERRAYIEEMRKKMEAEPPPPMVEANLFFADYQKVDGVLLPHKITRQVEGQVQEVWTIDKYKLNVALTPEQFQKKSSE